MVALHSPEIIELLFLAKAAPHIHKWSEIIKSRTKEKWRWYGLIFISVFISPFPLGFSLLFSSPPAGRIKLNTDGCKKAGGEGGFGGLLRDERGAWVCGYYGRMQMATSLEAELWAVYKGLTVILQKGLYNVLIETDTAQVVKLMEEETADNCPFKSLVDDAKILLRGCECTIQHIWKEGNLCTDALAKLRAAQPEDILVVNDPPAEIRGLLVRGMIGLSCEWA